jgi:hypothetical protein
MLSSAKEALNLLQQQFENDNEAQSDRRQNRQQSSRRSSSRQEWKLEELESLLNIIRDKAEQVEGNLQLEFAGAQRFFPFDNNTMDKLPRRT